MNITKVFTELEISGLRNFLLEHSTFDFKLTTGEINQINNIGEGIDNSALNYWIAMENEKVVAAIGVFENDYQTGGYEFDFFAVDKSYRHKGIGKMLLDELEKFVKEKGGRFILVSTGSMDSSASARKFYEKNGYIQVGSTPDFFYNGDVKIDYYKKI